MIGSWTGLISMLWAVQGSGSFEGGDESMCGGGVLGGRWQILGLETSPPYVEMVLGRSRWILGSWFIQGSDHCCIDHAINDHLGCEVMWWGGVIDGLF